jgi:hypothetical protein
MGEAKVTGQQVLDWFKEHGGKLHTSLGVSKVQKTLQLTTTKAIKKGETLFEVPDELILSLDSSDFAEIEFNEKHNTLFNDFTPYRVQTLLTLYEFLKPKCAITFEAPTITRKKKKKKSQREAAAKQVSGPVTGKRNERPWCNQSDRLFL